MQRSIRYGVTLLSLALSSMVMASEASFAQTTRNTKIGLISPTTRTSVVTRTPESARSDKFSGGRIARTRLIAGEPDIEITVDVPSFKLTLWQNGKEVKTYYVGVGRAEFPISIGEREATQVIWNPAWVPPNSEWVLKIKGITPLEPILAGDPRNPLGKLKIPLGGGYLIHQARKPTDLGNLVSHGCVRMLQRDIFDLAEKIVRARDADVSAREIAAAKRSKKSLVVELDEPLPVDINYDTQVVEGGRLHIYYDVYSRGTNTVKNLRAELESSGVDAKNLTDETLQKMLDRASRGRVFVVPVASIEANRALTDGKLQPLIVTASTKKPANKAQRATAKRPASRT